MFRVSRFNSLFGFIKKVYTSNMAAWF